MKRRLGLFEQALALTDDYSPFNVVAVVRLSGSPGPDAMRQALDILQHRHPLLGVHIVRSGRRRLFESGSIPAIPLRLIQRTDDSHWLRSVEEELNRRVDTAVGPLVRCSYLLNRADGGDSEILLTFPHVAVDGPSGVNLCHELLSLCVAAGERETPAGFDPLPPPPAAEDSFPPAFQGWSRTRRMMMFFLRQMADELSYRLWSRGTGTTSPDPAARSRVLPMRISKAATASLVRYARRRRVTLASVLHAAVLLAMSKHLYGGQDLPLRYLVFPSLRRYLLPPVSAEHLAPLLTMMRFTIRVGPDRDLWSLAQAVNVQTHAAFKRGDKFLFPLLSVPMMRILIKRKSHRMGTTALSYTGVPEIRPTYGSHRVLGVHAFVSNIDLGPAFTAQARLFDGELIWDIVYMDCDLEPSQASLIAEEIRGMLQASSSREAEPKKQSPGVP